MSGHPTWLPRVSDLDLGPSEQELQDEHELQERIERATQEHLEAGVGSGDSPGSLCENKRPSPEELFNGTPEEKESLAKAVEDRVKAGLLGGDE